MADNSRIVVTMARCLAIGHIIIGFMLLCFGIADGATTDLYDYYEFWVGSVYFGVWIGLWVGDHRISSLYIKFYSLIKVLEYRDHS